MSDPCDLNSKVYESSDVGAVIYRRVIRETVVL